MAFNTRIKIGKTSVRTPRYMSEPGYVKQVNAIAKELTDNLQYILDQFADVAPDFMLEALRPTFEKTQTRVPVRGGTLKRSGYLQKVNTSRGNPQVEMGYAKGGNPDYAIYVHEMVDIPHTPPTSAKFVQGPVEEDMGEIIDRLAAQYREFMRA